MHILRSHTLHILNDALRLLSSGFLPVTFCYADIHVAMVDPTILH